MDPLARKYPGMSPYNGLGDNPILYVDPDGKEIYIQVYEKIKNEDGKTKLKVTKLRYDGDNLLNEDGSIYDGENPFALDARQALNHLKATEASKINFGGENDEPVDIIDAFVGNEEHDIFLEQGSEGEYLPGSNFIEWSPREGSKFLIKPPDEIFIPSESDYGYASPSAALGHELIHAYNDHFDNDAFLSRHGTKYNRDEHPYFPNQEEEEATLNWGNQVHKALGEDKRINYRISIYTTTSPISTSPKGE